MVSPTANDIGRRQDIFALLWRLVIRSMDGSRVAGGCGGWMAQSVGRAIQVVDGKSKRSINRQLIGPAGP